MSEPRRLKLGFVCCSGGGLIDALSRISRGGDWPFSIGGVITDRACGGEDIARTYDLAHRRIIEPDNDLFSEQAAACFRGWEVDLVVLLFLRRVGPALWRNSGAPVWNLHPSLLPAYPGIGALMENYDDAKRDSSISMGLTLHVASGDLDAGPVLGQVRFDAAQVPTLQQAEHLSFLLKTMLLLEGMQNLAEGELAETDQNDIHRLAWDGSFRGMIPRTRSIGAAEAFAQAWAQTVLEDLAGVRRP